MRRSFIQLPAGCCIAAASLALAACSDPVDMPQPEETGMPEGMERAAPPPARQDDAGQEIEIIGTPMADRVATIGVLNKRNNLSQDVELKPGESRRIGDLIIRLSACERTQPFEIEKETGAFVQVLVRSAGDEGEWGKVFSGWLFKNSPSLNVVEHPIYDVWVKDCAMSFPGDAAPSDSSDAKESDSE